jgi:putative molybdopterin biosynthesis protein
MATFGNNLSRLRQERGLTQQNVADRVGLARQSLNTIEVGRSVPSTEVALRLARLLSCKVEDLFWLDQTTVELDTELARGSDEARHERAVVASIGGKWIAHALEASSVLTAADGILAAQRPTRSLKRPSGARVRLLATRQALADTLLCAGCAPILGILAARSSREALFHRVVWLDRSSTMSLDLLRRGHVHVAGVHLFDEATQEFNVSFVEQKFPRLAMRVFTLGRWDAGLVVPRGNPQGLRRIEDLARPRLRVVEREAGSGAQSLLERLRKAAGVPASEIHFRGPTARSHLDVARAVALGAADTGLAIRGVALALNLGFVPLAEERFDLVIPSDLSYDPRAARLLDTLASGIFRREVEALGGYTVRDSGALVVETAAA